MAAQSNPALPADTDTIPTGLPARPLPATEVTAVRFRHHPPGAQGATFDSTHLSLHHTENVADLLWKKSGLYVKSYGMGSLATTSARGGGAAQTAIVWNGLPLQSPMLGQLDFSLLPLVFVDELTVQYGGNSAGWGSGAIGGAVLLDNKAQYLKGLSASIGTAAGSFGWQQHTAAFRYGNGRLSGSTRVFWEKADNDFHFRPHPTLPEKRQEHAALQQRGLLQEWLLRTPSGHELAWRAWLQDTDREIPPTLVQSRSAASQADALLRTMLHWKKTGKTTVWQARAAFFSETLDYRDPLIGQDARSRFYLWTGELEATHALGRHWLLQGTLNHAHTRATTPAYSAAAEQNRTAAFVALRRDGRIWQAQADLRMEQVDGALTPVTPGIGATLDASRFLKIKAKIARNYRIPTLNDRYWQPGGNPDLLPESGWSEDLGLVLHGRQERLRWSYSATAFNRRIRNWILWARQDGQVFFSPQNIAEVWSRGVEQRFDLALPCPFGEIALSGGYDLVHSTNLRAVASPRIEAGAQLFYVPRHRFFGEVSVRVHAFQITRFQQFTGAVTGLLEPIPGFGTGSLRLQYTPSASWWRGVFFVQIENLWNEHYQVIERRPMPGRYFRVGANNTIAPAQHR